MRRTDASWRDLPDRHGPYTSVCNRFNRWATRGIWLGIFEEPARRAPHSLHVIDRSIVRAHQHAGGEGKGGRRSRHRPFSWRTEHQNHRCRWQDGVPVELPITPGQATDMTAASSLLDALRPGIVIADRGYDSRALIELMRDGGGEAHIPAQCRVRIQRSVPADLHRPRNLAERVFCNLNSFAVLRPALTRTPTPSWPPSQWHPQGCGCGPVGP